ncbi:hypothetical protein ACJJTC_009290 [Scirpophaga incertulas]
MLLLKNKSQRLSDLSQRPCIGVLVSSDEQVSGGWFPKPPKPFVTTATLQRVSGDSYQKRSHPSTSPRSGDIGGPPDAGVWTFLSRPDLPYKMPVLVPKNFSTPISVLIILPDRGGTTVAPLESLVEFGWVLWELWALKVSQNGGRTVKIVFQMVITPKILVVERRGFLRGSGRDLGFPLRGLFGVVESFREISVRKFLKFKNRIGFLILKWLVSRPAAPFLMVCRTLLS